MLLRNMIDNFQAYKRAAKTMLALRRKKTQSVLLRFWLIIHEGGSSHMSMIVAGFSDVSLGYGKFPNPEFMRFLLDSYPKSQELSLNPTKLKSVLK
jgi:hypothetical protein